MDLSPFVRAVVAAADPLAAQTPRRDALWRHALVHLRWLAFLGERPRR